MPGRSSQPDSLPGHPSRPVATSSATQRTITGNSPCPDARDRHLEGAGIEGSRFLLGKPACLVSTSRRVLVESTTAWTAKKDQLAVLIAADLWDMAVPPVLIVGAIPASEILGRHV